MQNRFQSTHEPLDDRTLGRHLPNNLDVSAGERLVQLSNPTQHCLAKICKLGRIQIMPEQHRSVRLILASELCQPATLRAKEPTIDDGPPQTTLVVELVVGIVTPIDCQEAIRAETGDNRW